MTNLRTVSFEKTSILTYSIKVVNGWAVFSCTKSSFSLPAFGEVVADSDNAFLYLLTLKKSPRIFQGSFIKETIMVPEYDEYLGGREPDKPTGNYIPTQIANFLPVQDNKYYYQFLLGEKNDISFSKDFDIIFDGCAEDPFHSERYLRYVYAALPLDVPLIMDSSNCVCISPFAS